MRFCFTQTLCDHSETFLTRITGSHSLSITPVHCGSIRQTATILTMNKDCLRTGDKATVHFRFIKTPEYLHCDQKLVFREGRTKAVGTITKVAELLLTSVFQCRYGIPLHDSHSSVDIKNTHSCRSTDTGCVCVFSFSNQWTPRQLRPSRPRCSPVRRHRKKAQQRTRRLDQQHGRLVPTQHSYQWVNPRSMSLYNV